MSNELNVKDLDAVTGGFFGLGTWFASYARSQEVPYPTGPLPDMLPGGPVGGNGGGSGGRCPKHH
jgi:hypothetical protein